MGIVSGFPDNQGRDVEQKLAQKQDKLSGKNGQIIVFDSAGMPAAQDVKSVPLFETGPWLPLSGGTVNGPLVTQAPTEEGHAANKKYVDGLVGDIGAVLDHINGEAI